jgi:hypothetical protein
LAGDRPPQLQDLPVEHLPVVPIDLQVPKLVRDAVELAGSSVRCATAAPTPSGMSSASPIQTNRTTEADTLAGNGTIATIWTATLGARTPISSSGQATAATIRIERKIRFPAVV